MYRSSKRLLRSYFCVVLALLPVLHGVAQEKVAPTPFTPPIAEASEEAVQAMAAFSAPEGFAFESVAAEPLLANPVAFYVDFSGNFYVAETFRHHHGVGDMRGHRSWLVDDLASRTVEDRLVAMKKNLGTDFPAWSEAHDRVRKLWDSDGDGVADQATVFADGFKDALAGIGAGVLVDRGDVYYTCIPELWKLTDRDDDGVSDERRILSSGYGVHINFLGHDLHGLRKGPDGRLYFSIGDRGVSIKLPDGSRLEEPDTGAVFRCNLDGSGLEIVHRGLRNPQELAFDNYGNLFSGDNNSDGGDQARWVWIVEGGDSGWRIGYQWVTAPDNRGPWNGEKMWQPWFDGQPAHIVAPLLNIGAGPSGLAFYPGTGMSSAYNDTFFLCDFRGDAGRSLIHALQMTPKGAGFEVVNRHDFANHMLATDVEFGMKPGIYFSDWVQGWDKPNKGRLYRIHEPALAEDEQHAEAVRLLGEGMSHRSPEELVALLGHRDQRVRFEAQYALADLHGDGLAHLELAARTGEKLLARLHAIWGQWQLILQGDGDATALVPLLNDPEEEVRIQVARVLAEAPGEIALVPLRTALSDGSVRVQFHAATSLGRLGVHDGDTVSALVALIRRNNNVDTYLRHGAVVGLAGQAEEGQLAQLALDPDPAVRLGGLLALRRLESAETARFLSDASPTIVQEAIRAIHDTPILGAYPALAALADGATAPASEDLYGWRRILNAHFRLGGAENAQALLALATQERIPEYARIEALNNVARWSTPPALDTVTGAWHRVADGRATTVGDLVSGALPSLLGMGGSSYVLALGTLCDAYALDGAVPALVALVANTEASERERVAAMQLVARRDRDALRPVMAQALNDPSDSVRAESLTQIVALDPAAAGAAIVARLETGSTREKQAAVVAIRSLDGAQQDGLLLPLLAQLKEGTLDPVVLLEVVESARASSNPTVLAALQAYEAGAVEPDALFAYAAARAGGDTVRGRKIFLEKTETQCLRCHTLEDKGGSEVGPVLTGIGARVDRNHILEAIVAPNATIAEGFENVSVTLANGDFFTGRLIEESESSLVLDVQQEADPFADEDIPHSVVDTVAEDAAHGEGAPAAENLVRMTFAKSDIQERKRALSSMPEGLANFISLAELRDLVEFLATRK